MNLGTEFQGVSSPLFPKERKDEDMKEQSLNGDKETEPSEILNNSLILKLKARMATSSKSLFEKDDGQKLNRTHPSLLFLKWFLRLFLILLIPINLIGYLVGTRTGLQNLNHSLQLGVFGLRMLNAHLTAEDSIVTLCYLNGDNYDGLLSQNLTTEIISQSQQTLNESVSILTAQLTNEFFKEIVYHDLVEYNANYLSQDEISTRMEAATDEIETLAFQNGTDPDQLDDHYDSSFYQIVTALSLTNQLDPTAVSLNNKVVYNYYQQVLEKVLDKLFDISGGYFQSFPSYAQKSKNFLTTFLFSETGLLIIGMLIIQRLISREFEAERTIIETFGLINEAAIKEAFYFYHKLWSCFPQNSSSKKKIIRGDELMSVSKAKKEKIHRVRRMMDSSGIFGNSKLIIMGQVSLVIFIGLLLSLILLVTPINFFSQTEAFGIAIQQLCKTNIKLPLFETQLKQAKIDPDLYWNYILPINTDEIAKLSSDFRTSPSSTCEQFAILQQI